MKTDHGRDRRLLQKNRTSQGSAKVHVSYLMSTPRIQELEPEPTEAASGIYDDNKVADSRSPRAPAGEQHKDDEKPEYKTFDEVKAEIPNKTSRRPPPEGRGS